MLVSKDVLTPVLVFLSTVLGAWLLRRTEVAKLRQSAHTEVRAGYKSVIDELQEQMIESRADRRAMREEIAELRLQIRDLARAERTARNRLDELTEHVRLLRALLRRHKIEGTPPPPVWFDDPLSDSWPPTPATT
jgi:chromosome segregation ATPase